MNHLCIYHSNCADGFTAAWVVKQALGDNVEFHPGTYGNPPPDVKGKDVILVDFSYKRPVLEAMLQQCKSLIVLDHHKTAQEDLNFLPPTWSTWQDHAEMPSHKGHAVFDMNRSGARITWDFFFPKEAPPELLLHVEDRDLWRFALPQTREIQANVFSYPYEFDVWDQLMATNTAELAKEGAALERKHFKDVAELLKVVTRPMRIGGFVVDVANLPYTMTSDAGHALAIGKPFGACYWDTPEGRVFSLRSTDEGQDVSEIARQYGGGGHRNASGFRVSYEQAREFEI